MALAVATPIVAATILARWTPLVLDETGPSFGVNGSGRRQTSQ